MPRELAAEGTDEAGELLSITAGPAWGTDSVAKGGSTSASVGPTGGTDSAGKPSSYDAVVLAGLNKKGPITPEEPVSTAGPAWGTDFATMAGPAWGTDAAVLRPLSIIASLFPVVALLEPSKPHNRARTRKTERPDTEPANAGAMRIFCASQRHCQ